METNQNKSSQPQGRSNQFNQGNSSSSQFSQSSSNAPQGSSSQSSSSGSNQRSSNPSSSASSLGGLNMDNLSQQWQKYSGPILNKVNSLSTTQKVVGGTLLAAGAGWLAMNSRNKNKSTNNLNRTPKKR